MFSVENLGLLFNKSAAWNYRPLQKKNSFKENLENSEKPGK